MELASETLQDGIGPPNDVSSRGLNTLELVGAHGRAPAQAAQPTLTRWLWGHPRRPLSGAIVVPNAERARYPRKSLSGKRESASGRTESSCHLDRACRWATICQPVGTNEWVCSLFSPSALARSAAGSRCHWPSRGRAAGEHQQRPERRARQRQRASGKARVAPVCSTETH